MYNILLQVRKTIIKEKPQIDLVLRVLNKKLR